MRSIVRVLVGALPLLALFAGCFGGSEPSNGATPSTDLPEKLPPLVASVVDTKAGPLHAEIASGAISRFTLNGTGRIEFPPNVFLLQGNKFSTAKSVDATAGTAVALLLPPGMTRLNLTVAGETVSFDVLDTGFTLVQGEDVVEWFKVQHEKFPNRCARCPNYVKAQQYFAQLFRSFGYATVDIDPYGTNAVHSEFANVVAYKYPKTDVLHPLYLGTGGHYDVVTGTVDGALDDTSGTLGAMELAKVFANISTNRNLVFGLWGGEESGLQGSAFFTKTNPNIAAQMQVYVNLDSSAFSWPMPRPVTKDSDARPDCSKLIPISQQSPTAAIACPDPVLVTAGPDGPESDLLLQLGRKIQHDIAVGWPDAYFVYEPVVSGQASGYAKINAQSDHTSFIAAGVPSYMLIDGDITRNPVGFHNRRDALENWTKYAYHNWYVNFEDELTPEQLEEAERLVVKSIETHLWLAFYILLHYDLGLAPLPATAPIPAS